MKRFILIALAALLMALPAIAQMTKGSITGTVQDPQGRVIPGAQVTITNVATGVKSEGVTSDVGVFRFSLLNVGDYRVQISAPGFKAAATTASVVAAKDIDLGEIRLTVGGGTEVVEVTAATPLITTNESQVTNTFNTQQLTEIPTVSSGQGLDNLALLLPGIQNDRDNSFSNTNGTGFSVNGLRGRNNDQQVDGQNNNDNSVGGPSVFLFNPEFVAQYNIVTDNFGSEFGRNAGSVVNIITKSGTNEWHGSIYGTYNNSVLNAMGNVQKRFSHLKKNPRSNEPFTGFALGGPIVKDKAFIFGGFDSDLYTAMNSIQDDYLTPTPAGLATLVGCFPASASLQALVSFGPYAISAGNPTPTNPEPDPFANLAAVCPGVQFGGVHRTLPVPAHTFDFIVRPDWIIGNNSFSARYIFQHQTFANNDYGNGAAGYVDNVPSLSQGINLGWTRTISNRQVNDFKVNFSRLKVIFGGNNIGNTTPPPSQLSSTLTGVIFYDPGLMGFGDANNLPQSRVVNTWQAQDNWRYSLGKHQLKAGVNYTFQRSLNIFLPYQQGQYRFKDWLAFMNNTPNRVRIAMGDPGLDFREHDLFAYFGDDWRATPNLTFNMGVTWTYFGQPANFFHTRDVARESDPATALWNPAVDMTWRSSPKLDPTYHYFGPNVGFAYTPHWGKLTGEGKTVIRGGYRLAYDPPFYNIYLNMASAAPQVLLRSFSGVSAASKPMPAVPTAANVQAALAPFLTTGVLDPRTANNTGITPDFGADHVHSWQFGVQREITPGAVAEVRYVGNRARRLFQTNDGNPYIADLAADYPQFIPSGMVPCTAPAIAGNLGRVRCDGPSVLRERANTGYSDYNGLQAELRATNLWNQLALQASYTWSKTTDNVSEIFATGGGGNTNFSSQNPVDYTKGEHALSGLDIPHKFALSFYEQIPIFRDQKGFVGHVLGGWAVAGTYMIASGQPYTPVQLFSAYASAAGDYYDYTYIGGFVGIDTARPFWSNKSAPATSVGIYAADACYLFGIGCVGYADSQLLSMNAINATTPSAVTVNDSDVRYIVNAWEAQQLFGTPFGNVPRSAARDAWTNRGDFSLYKTFKLNERASFRFTVTLNNVFNHPNFTSIDPYIEDAGLIGAYSGFGDPTTYGSGPRRILFGARLTF